ncbi:MAG: hypothetical protein WC087_02200 [Candidatus Paceibacterota bacterium]
MNLEEISKLYDDPQDAMRILQTSVEGKHRYFRNEKAFERFLRKEQDSYQRRKTAGVSSPVSLLENTLDSSPLRNETLPPGSNGFNVIIWQETSKG